MKKIAVLLSLIAVMLTSCIPTPPIGGTTRIKAKLIRTTCASIVLQIQDPNYYYLGEQWSDIFSPLTVMTDNAVKVSNTCEFPSDIISVGDVFYFEINTNPRTDCVICMLYDAPPTKSVAVKNITRN
jgi:hypothetical protein